MRTIVASAIFLLPQTCPSVLVAQSRTPPASSPAPSDRAVGKVKSVTGNTITITTDAGADVGIQVSDSTRLLKIAPGQKDLKDATPIPLTEIQSGDRILVRGKPSTSGTFLDATTAIVMKASDVTAKQEHDREDWKQRGVGGLVSSVDPASQTIAISVPGFGGNKTIKVLVAKDTVLRRYAPDSIKFDDAKPGTFAEIKSGDQLRARGDRSTDGSELTAQEVVTGAFRNIAGTVVSTDPAKNTLTVIDLATKKPVVLAIDADSQMRKLSPMVAQRIAMRLKGGPGETPRSGAPPAAPPAPAGAAGAAASPGANGKSGGAPDFQQLLGRMPPATLNDLQKGDAVMLVSTQGSDTTPPKAVTLLSGVEPILTASPNRGAMLLSPWNIGGGGGGDSGGGANP